jgi:hypothetical protein
MRLYAYDRDGHPIADTPAGFGRAHYDQYTVLILFRYSRDDLGERPVSPLAR